MYIMNYNLIQIKNMKLMLKFVMKKKGYRELKI